MMRPIHTADSPVEAHIVKGLLEAKGIYTEVHHEDMIGGYPTVWVPSNANFQVIHETILALLHKHSMPETKGESWRCPSCG